eukprot:364199-Chlamydomonas_euryale.AAC.14
MRWHLRIFMSRQSPRVHYVTHWSARQGGQTPSEEGLQPCLSAAWSVQLQPCLTPSRRVLYLQPCLAGRTQLQPCKASAGRHQVLTCWAVGSSYTVVHVRGMACSHGCLQHDVNYCTQGRGEGVKTP